MPDAPTPAPSAPEVPAPTRRLLTAVFRLQLAQRHVTARLSEQSGLSESDLVALGLLSNREPAPVKELATDLGLNPGSTSTLVDRLTRAGMVRREPSPHDRRVQLVAITARGAELMASARDRYLAAFDQSLGAVTQDCLATASSVLSEVSAHLLEDGEPARR